MSIIRVNKGKNYFYASNEPFNDNNLSWGARGIMGYLLSKPDGWEVRNYDLYRQAPDGKYRVDGYLKELKEQGYLRRYRVSNGKSGIEWVTEVYERKDMNPDYEPPNDDDLSMSGFSTVENSTDKISEVEKTPHIVNTNSVKTKSLNTEIDIKEEEKVTKVSKTFESEISLISPMTNDLIKEWCDLFPIDWIIKAIKAAALQNVRKPAYVNGILEKWQRIGGPQNDKPKGQYNGHSPGKRATHEAQRERPKVEIAPSRIAKLEALTVGGPI